MLTRLTGVDIPDDSPVLKYLQTVHLSVADELRGRGTLDWSEASAPPEGKEASMKQMQNGLQQSVSGFFQSWNAYMNGSMVPLPDSSLTVTEAGEGVHLSGAAKEMKIDEDFDKNTVLTRALVVSPAIKVVALPTYAETTDGLILTSVQSTINQPPTAPPIEATFRIEYAKVDSFQLPSHIVLDIRNIGIIELAFSGCHTTLADWAKKQ